MGYFGEFRQNLRSLIAATMGSSIGLLLIGYITSIFAPFLLNEFQWPKTQFALIGLSSFVGMIVISFVGYLTDRLGVRRVAAVGVIGLPLVFLLASRMNGDFREFFAISVLQITFGAMVSTVVFTRIVAERFHAARGLALTVVTCGPAVVGAIGGSLLARRISRTRCVRGYSRLSRTDADAASPPARSRGPSRPAHARRRCGLPPHRSEPCVLLILVGLLLCNFYSTLQGSQLKLLMLDNGLGSAAAASILSVFATGTIVGRIACGVALDYLPSHLVATVSLGLPGFGFLLLASPFDQPVAVGFAMLLMGLSLGVEGDLVAEWFDVDLYGTVLGLLSGVLTFSAASGSLLLSFTLRVSSGYEPFLVIVSAAILAGSLLLLLLGSNTVRAGPLAARGAAQ